LLHGCNRLRRRTRAVLEAFAVIEVRDPPGAVVDLSSLTIVPSTIRIVRPMPSSGYAPIPEATRYTRNAAIPPLLPRRLNRTTSEMSVHFARFARTTAPATSSPAPRAALAYATASQAMESHVIVRPHRTAKPFAAILRETTMRALASFLQRYAFTKHRCTNITTCSLSSLVGRLLS